MVGWVKASLPSALEGVTYGFSHLPLCAMFWYTSPHLDSELSAPHNLPVHTSCPAGPAAEPEEYPAAWPPQVGGTAAAAFPGRVTPVHSARQTQQPDDLDTKQIICKNSAKVEACLINALALLFAPETNC